VAAARADIVLPARGAFVLAGVVAASGAEPPAPWVWSGGARPVLRRAETRPDGRVYLLEVRPAPRGVVLRVLGPDAGEAEVLVPLAAAVRRALWLDLDLRPLRRLCRGDPGLAALSRRGLVPPPRGTTAFEDVVVAVTRAEAGAAAGSVLRRLVARLGRRAGDGRTRAFPTPGRLAVAATSVCAQAGVSSLGRRLARLGAAVAAGRIDPGALDSPDPRAPAAALRALPGLTPAAAQALRLALGDFAWGACPRGLPAVARPWRALVASALARVGEEAAAPPVGRISARRAAPGRREPPRTARGTPRPRRPAP